LWIPAAVAAAAVVMIMNPAARTKGYFAVERQWAAHWPFARGAALPTRFKAIVRPTAPAWVQVEPGITMRLDPEDYVSREILRTGAWEKESWDAIRQHLPAGAVFVDVGAHIGYYSLKAASAVGTGGHVIAVEPNPPTVRELEDNIRASGATVISVQPVACSDAETTLDLFAAPRVNTGQTSLSQANASQGGQAVTTYHVRARPLDDIVKDTGVSRVDVVKIDVEGAEMLVLKGSVGTLARYHPVLMVELIDQQLRSLGSSEAGVRAFLRTHGYTARGTFQDNVEFGWDAAAR
jgi:FkbM family methyltransferase